MLFNLSIENVALIKKADINFSDGFSVLTGETGAGKSILIGSVNMLLGERATKDIIRHDEKYAYVEGVFYLKDEVIDEFKKLDIEIDEDKCVIVSRKLMTDGKNLCKVNGKTVPVSFLREVGRNLINIHGQHDNQALLDAKFHIVFLDAYCKKHHQKLFDEFASVYTEYVTYKKELDKLDVDETEKLRKIDILQFEIDEITAAEIVIGEESELKIKRDFVKNREHILKNCSGALTVLSDSDDENAYSLVSQAVRFIEKNGDASSEKMSERLNDVLFGIEEITSDIRRYMEQIVVDDISLDEIEERLDVIYKLKRKYGNSEEAVIQYCEKAQNELDSILFADEKKAELNNKIETLYNASVLLAEKISKLRKECAKRIESEIDAQLSELNMSGSRFVVEFNFTDLNRNGLDDVEFLISTNPGEPEKTLTKIVSGGELSRIMLAMKNILTAGDTADTLIFDEIDTGISGTTAGKVGRKLANISSKKQVLCVTHLPQIAALSDYHFKLSKESENNETNTYITSLDFDGKVKEIAYMISGDTMSETSLAQAREMINKKE